MPTTAQLHSRRGGAVADAAPSLSASASAASWTSATAPSALRQRSDVRGVRCTVQFEYAAPAVPALFATPTPSTVQLVTAALSSPSSSSERTSEAGLWLQPTPHATRSPSIPDGGAAAAVQPPFRDAAHYDHVATSPPRGGPHLGLSTTTRPSTVRAVRRQAPARLPLQQPPAGLRVWLPLAAITALHWHSREDDDDVAPSRGSAVSSICSSGGGVSAPGVVVVVLRCAGDWLGHGTRAPTVVRLDGLRYSDALALATAYDSVAERAPIHTNNAVIVSRPAGQPANGHRTSPTADAAQRHGAGEQTSAVALINTFPSPLAVHVDPVGHAPGSGSGACSSPASPLGPDRCGDAGLPANGHAKSAAFATYARLLGGHAAAADATARKSTFLRAANGTWTAHAADNNNSNEDDDDDDEQRLARNHTAPQSPTAHPCHAGHLFHSVASFGDSTMTLPDSSPATSALYSPLGIAQQESSSAAWSSPPHPSPDDDGLPAGAPAAAAAAMWSSTAIARAGRPFAADEASLHVPRWFPPAPDGLSDVSETTVGSSRGTTPLGELSLPTTPLHRGDAERPSLPPPSRAAAGATGARTPAVRSAPPAVVTAMPAALSAANARPSPASAPPPPRPPHQQWPQPTHSSAPPPPPPRVSQDRVRGALPCLTAEQRELVNFDRFLRPTLPPPADGATPVLPGQTNGAVRGGAPQPVPPPQAALEEILLRLRASALARHALVPTDEADSPLTAAGAAQSACLSVTGIDNDDTVSRFTLAAPVTCTSPSASVVQLPLQPTAPLPRRVSAPLDAGFIGVTPGTRAAPPVVPSAVAVGSVPHRAHGPFAQPRQHPTALFLAQGGLRAPSASARPMRHGTVPHFAHPLYTAGLDSALVTEALSKPLDEGGGTHESDAAAEAQRSGSSAESGESAVASSGTARQGRSGSLRTRGGSGTRPPQSPPRMLPRRPDPVKGPQSLVLDGAALLVRTPKDEEESVPSSTTMAT